MHDGSKLYLKKVAEDYDPTDKLAALRLIHETARRGEFATGMLYVEPDKDDFVTLLDLVDEPLATLPLERVRPGARRSTKSWKVSGSLLMRKLTFGDRRRWPCCRRRRSSARASGR